MLGSNNAAGYLKLDLGLRKTEIKVPYLDWDLGYFECRLWTGQLIESDYFDTNEYNNRRMLNALSISYNPSFIPGFTIGLNRIFMTYWKAENLKYLGRLFTSSRENALSSSGNDEDQKFAIFVEWAFTEAGFKIYGEYGCDDFSSDEDTNPFHTAIYTIGGKQNIPIKLTKVFPKWEKARDFQSELLFEWNDFEMSQDFQLQWPYIGYYGHGFVRQGYTHKGQIIGAGSGWAGNSQFIQYKVYYPKGYAALKFHRYCPNNNSVYSQGVNASSNNGKSELSSKWYANFETYFVWGVETGNIIKEDLFVTLSTNFIYMPNKNYIFNNNDFNMNFSLNLKYNL